jgi:hypothetical protein
MSRPLREPRLAFADAVHALAEDPTSVNVVRYLVASRNLEESSRAEVSEPRGRHDPVAYVREAV